MRIRMLCMAIIGAFLTIAPAFAEDKMPVVATFSIIGDMAQTVGGEDIFLTTLVGPAQDAHSYTPTAADIKAVQQARVVVANGLGFEPWLNRLLAAANYQGVVVIATQGLTPRQMEEDQVSVTDPHAWQNVSNSRLYVRNIASAFAQADQPHASAYETRAAAYEAALATLDEEIRRLFTDIPTERRKIITSHDAFGYFGDAYGLTFMAPAGLSTEDEPSAATLARLIGQLKSQQVHTVFLENMASPRLATQLAADAGAQIGGTLYADALSALDGEAPTYVALIRHNARLLAEATKAP